jgi:MFS family permease
MLDLSLFRLRAFTGAGVANLLSSMGRGGLQFMLVLWLQGIWLPLHGYSFESTPLWSGIYMVPLSVGYLASGPLAGRLSDRYGQKWFSTVGMFGAAASFVALLLLPIDFDYPDFAVLVLLNGVFVGLFSAPNTTTMMNAVPADQRGAASGMRATFMNSGFVLSIGIFFSLMIVGLAATLPGAMLHGLQAQGVPAVNAHRVASLPAVGTLFAAFLGYNPIRTLLGSHVLTHVGSVHAAVLTGKRFFPSLISGPFHHGLVVAFGASALLCAGAGVASLWAGNPVDPETTLHRGPALTATAASVGADGASAGLVTDDPIADVPEAAVERGAVEPPTVEPVAVRARGAGDR